LKNIHVQLFFVIIALTIGAAVAIWMLPTRMGLDIRGGMRVVLRAKAEEAKGAWTRESLEVTKEIIRNRVDSLGVAEPVIYTKPESNQIIVELPGLTNKQQARDTISTTARLEFRYVPELEGTWSTSEERTADGKLTGFEKIFGPDGKEVSAEELQARIFSKDPVLTGNELLPNARAELTTEGTIIHFEFRNDSKRVFEEFTRGYRGKRLAIFLDKKLISAPVIEDVIPGIGIIRGNFTPEQAKTLANQLNAGALPVPLEWLYDLSVEPTLGRQAVQQTLVAGIVGLITILVFMAWFYRLPGFLANIALILYTVFTLALFKLIPVTLTVPGIAGFILSIGMAVDANILIFERFKEERMAGKTIRAAIEAGFKRAFSAIFDSNMCTLITCYILWYFGTGPVKGFAVTLAIGVAVSMFTAITCSRTLLLLVANTGIGQNDNAYALTRGMHPKLGVTRRLYLWFGISLALIIPGLIFMGLGGIKRSIEFSGGTELSAQFQQRPTVASVQNLLRSVGINESRIIIAEGNRAIITMRTLSEEDQRRLDQLFQSQNILKESSETVSPAISRELTRNAFLSIVIASTLILLYLAIRFAIGGFIEGMKFGTCALIAMIHDVLVVLGLFAIMGYFFNWKIDSLFVTAMLTVIGYSVHDTIVIFDRIRENLRHRAKGDTFAHIVDSSIEQTFTRSINTSVTVIFVLLALLILGGPVVRLFVTALLIGIVSGTYSSIFNASPLMVLWKQLTSEKLQPAVAGAGAASGVKPAPRAADTVRPRETAAAQKVQTAAASPTEENGSQSATTVADTARRAKGRKKTRRM
jgi:SecD/SecF fusion protein